MLRKPFVKRPPSRRSCGGEGGSRRSDPSARIAGSPPFESDSRRPWIPGTGPAGRAVVRQPAADSRPASRSAAIPSSRQNLRSRFPARIAAGRGSSHRHYGPSRKLPLAARFSNSRSFSKLSPPDVLFFSGTDAAVTSNTTRPAFRLIRLRCHREGGVCESSFPA